MGLGSGLDGIRLGLLQCSPGQADAVRGLQGEAPHVDDMRELQEAAGAAGGHQGCAMCSAQAHVLIGQPGHKRSDPDYFALLVGNHVLGGNGFSSLLMNEVREKCGLSYGAYSHFQSALYAGAFSIGLQTRPDQAA